MRKGYEGEVIFDRNLRAVVVEESMMKKNDGRHDELSKFSYT